MANAVADAPSVQPPVRRLWGGLHPSVLHLASTHFVVDAYTNIYSPLLPLLIPHLGLSLTAAGTLAMSFQLATSVAQLGFGALADRWKPRVLLLGGPILAVTVLSFVGVADSPFALGAILVIGGLGGAAFHPPAAAMVYRLSDARKGFSMSVHISGGSLGMAMAPLAFVPFIAAWGLRWSPLIALPGLAALAVTLRYMPPMQRHADTSRGGWVALRPYAKPLAVLYFTVVLRTLAAASFSTFLTVLLTRQGLSIGQASAAVTVYLLVGALGGFSGGPLGDRFGSRRVILLSLVLSVPFLLGVAFLQGWPLAIAAAIGGLLLQSTLPINVTYAQVLAPVSAATVSSLMMGFAWGVGSALVPLVGLLADHLGLERALTVTALVPLLAAALASTLPERRGDVFS
jgi:FSR family fosmidomycin resistance protein-like MFS transporter